MKNLPTRLSLLAALLSMAFTTSVQAEEIKQPAFSGAEGFGKYARGGRGGDVYCVTNLHDDGPGSLRFAIETADNARTIVFDVAGTIRLARPLRMEGKSHLTIAGQTAPGNGITIRDHAFVIEKCSDIVVRYLRVRLGDKGKGPRKKHSSWANSNRTLIALVRPTRRLFGTPAARLFATASIRE